ncbi:MAG: GyrI-like domain-containing protein [Firmicutes bacterium]|nr:GyrI-like domain-containing protein [Bacillota bacterium]
MSKNDANYYVFGPGVKQVRFIPENLISFHIPGGLFAVFPVDKPKDPEDSTVLSENVQVTWFYALKQWLPSSDYMPDETRTPYEYYLDGENAVCMPVVLRGKA